MLVQNPIGLLLAALLSLPVLRFRTAYRTLIFMPTMLVGRHHRLHLATHSLAALGHRQDVPGRLSGWASCSARGWAKNQPR